MLLDLREKYLGRCTEIFELRGAMIDGFPAWDVTMLHRSLVEALRRAGAEGRWREEL
jgi:hypothetical protein